jgi:hypothetical protein
VRPCEAGGRALASGRRAWGSQRGRAGQRNFLAMESEIDGTAASRYEISTKCRMD